MDIKKVRSHTPPNLAPDFKLKIQNETKENQSFRSEKRAAKLIKPRCSV